MDKFSLVVNHNNRVQRFQRFHFFFQTDTGFDKCFEIINNYQYCFVDYIITHNYIHTMRFVTITSCPHNNMVSCTIHITRERILPILLY